MNFIRLFIGDYLRDTGTLTLAQHGAYFLMLLELCATEKPIPSGKGLHRLLRAESKHDRDAADAVAARFWRETDGGLVNGKAVQVIERAKKKAEASRANGELGGRPKKTYQVSKEEPKQNLHQNQKPEPEEAKSKEATASSSADADRCPVQEIVDLYHAKLPELPRTEKITKARRGQIQQRWREDLPDLDSWGRFFEDIRESAFLMGKTPGRDGKPPFRATLEWITNAGNFAKISEGNYHRG